MSINQTYGCVLTKLFQLKILTCLLILGDAHYPSLAEYFEWLCLLRFPATDFVYILKLESAGSSSIINKARGCFHNVFFTLKIYWFVIIVIRTDLVFVFYWGGLWFSWSYYRSSSFRDLLKHSCWWELAFVLVRKQCKASIDFLALSRFGRWLGRKAISFHRSVLLRVRA